MKKHIIAIASWAMAIWMCKVFLFSIPYKFTGHPDTQHIFSTIGGWMSGILGESLGSLFASFGPYAVGSFELLTSLVLLLPGLIWLLAIVGLVTSGEIQSGQKFTSLAVRWPLSSWQARYSFTWSRRWAL